jgi:hypothetical protein
VSTANFLDALWLVAGCDRPCSILLANIGFKNEFLHDANLLCTAALRKTRNKVFTVFLLLDGYGHMVLQLQHVRPKPHKINLSKNKMLCKGAQLGI